MPDRSITTRIKHIQTHLGLEPDGIIGPDTLTAIEQSIFDEPGQQSDHSLVLTRTGIDFIVQHEIGSVAYYNRYLKHPVWPGGQSGVTVGVGYDLGYQKEQQVRNDWSAHLSDRDLDKLLLVCGIKGELAKAAARRIGSVTIDIDQAADVFSRSTLPRFAADTLGVYPGVEDLHPDCQSALLSLVYNRGTSMRNSDSRREMRELREHVRRQDYDAIADAIASMKRIWEGRGLDGLLKRRDAEAMLVRDADRVYHDEELVYV